MIEKQSQRALWASPLGGELRDALELAGTVVSRVWSFQTQEKIRSLAVKGGVTDRESRVLVGSEDRTAYMLAGDGRLLWSLETGAWVRGVAFATLNEQSQLAIIGSDSIRVVDEVGNIVQDFPCESSVTCLHVANLGGNIRIISGHDDGQVEIREMTGELLWRAQLPKRVVAVECCDVDLDGEVEFAAACEDTNVYILSEDGSIQNCFRTSHWVISLAVGDVYADGIPRLLIAGLNGEIYVYGGGKTAALRIRSRAIVGVAMGRLTIESNREQFVVGTADQQVAIFETTGREVWRFSTSFGNRVIRILESDRGVSLIIGAEDGNAHCVALRIRDGLREQIVSIVRQLGLRELPSAEIGPSGALLLGDLVDLEERSATYEREKALEYARQGLVNECVDEFLGYWRKGAEESWKFKTGGRVYSVAHFGVDGAEELVLATSGDGYAYALDLASGAERWRFRAGGPVRGGQWIEDDAQYGPGALLGSEDGCLYRLDDAGRPVWHLQTGDWVLYVATSNRPWSTDSEAVAWFGSEGRYVEAVDRIGRPVWRVNTGDRTRSLAVADVDADGEDELIAGSDDRNIYVIDALRGVVKQQFEAPHWILAVAVKDIDSDGKQEILVGTEDGSCYVYSLMGVLKWAYRTGYWVAAIDTGPSAEGNELEVTVGSADSFLYRLSARGDLRWRWQAGARVRTVVDCGTDLGRSSRIVYGSYDEHVHHIRRVHSGEYRDTAREILRQLEETYPGPTTMHSGTEAMSALAWSDAALARTIFESSAPVAARAIVSSVLLADIEPNKNSELLQKIANFLAVEITEEECLAVARTASELGGSASVLAAVAEVIVNISEGARGQVRAAAIRPGSVLR